MQLHKKYNESNIKHFIKKNYAGYLAILPLILGILIFYAYPVICSLVYSFHDYNIFKGTLGKFTLHNYVEMFTSYKSTFLKSLKITLLYSIIMVPANMVLGFLIALWTNKKTKLMGICRLFLYLPSLIPAVVAGMIWQHVADVNYGIGNVILQGLGFEKFSFFNSADTSFTSIIIFSLFGTTSSLLIWLSSLKSVPTTYYEAAEVEGCNGFEKLIYITIPMCTPFILYNLLTNLIGSLQIFGNIFTITGGTSGMENSLLFFGIYIYQEAFSSFNISYASALSWVLFVIIAILSAILLKTSKWVYYSEEV